MNWFVSRRSSTKLDKFERDGGIDLVNMLVDKLNFCRVLRDPSHSGTTPVNWL